VIRDQDDKTRKLIVNVFESVLESGDYSQARVARKNEMTIRQSVGEDILESFRFQSITERFEEVAEAHRETFKWIFQKAENGPHAVHAGPNTKWSDFPNWLQQGTGLYWVNGKAASGKSTLMKYIRLHPGTHRYLTTWAGMTQQCTPLYVAGFFFWMSGTKDQKSQSGLLRSLFHDILQQDPRLIPIVFPKQ
jgi:hypothetical protein